MTHHSNYTVTDLLRAAESGMPDAYERLWSLLYEELRPIAAAVLANEPTACTLHTTALVHEAYQKLFKGSPPKFENWSHFFGAAASAMRQICVESARRRKALKRGGGQPPISLDENTIGINEEPETILDVHEALVSLAQSHPRPAKVVEFRFFAGLSIDETANVMDISARSVAKDWRFAQAWLRRALSRTRH